MAAGSRDKLEYLLKSFWGDIYSSPVLYETLAQSSVSLRARWADCAAEHNARWKGTHLERVKRWKGGVQNEEAEMARRGPSWQGGKRKRVRFARCRVLTSVKNLEFRRLTKSQAIGRPIEARNVAPALPHVDRTRSRVP